MWIAKARIGAMEGKVEDFFPKLWMCRWGSICTVPYEIVGRIIYVTTTIVGRRIYQTGIQQLLSMENIWTYIVCCVESKGAYKRCEYLKDGCKTPLNEPDQEGNLRGRHVEYESVNQQWKGWWPSSGHQIASRDLLGSERRNVRELLHPCSGFTMMKPDEIQE